MLPSGKLPRLLLFFVAAIILALCFDLTFVPPSPLNLLLSNSLDLAIVALATGTAFYWAFHSSSHPRQVWTLVGVTFLLQSCAQAITTYYQSFVPNASQSPWPSDVLFFAWPAPILLLFLPVSDEAPSGINWPRILDFIQVTIVAVTIYLYFFFSPARWARQDSILREILILHTVVRTEELDGVVVLPARSKKEPRGQDVRVCHAARS